MSRDQVLERIRAGLGDVPGRVGQAAEIVISGLPTLPAPQVFADPVGMFVERARQLSMTAEVVASMDDAAAQAAAWCAGRAARRVAVWSSADLQPVVDRIRAAGVEILAPGSRSTRWPADIGITGRSGDRGDATLVLSTDPGRPRLTSLLPPAHIAILRTDRILPDLPALFARCGALPSALTLVTGPSRSADIGFVPVLGAHGPMAVAVFVVSV
jgi:L-lactate dehydrogenase complex protein LldG